MLKIKIERAPKEYRKILLEELKDYQGEPIKLDVSSDLLKRILFMKITMYNKEEIGYFYLFEPVLKTYVCPKIDFSNIDLSDVYVAGSDLSKLHGIHINPQTITLKDATNTIFGNADFGNNSFDGVKVRGADFTGSKNVIMDPQTIYKNDLRGGKYPVKFLTSPSFAITDKNTSLEGSNYQEFDDTVANFRDNIKRLVREKDKIIEDVNF